MSQAKVDKYKEEKKNREKNVKKARVKKVAGVLAGAAIVGMIIGFPLGRIMYNHYYEDKQNNATVTAGVYDYWFQQYWNLNHADKFASSSSYTPESGLSDEEIDALVDELSSSSDAVILTPDDLNQDALIDALEDDASTTEAQ